jgi:hypothetical protein
VWLTNAFLLPSPRSVVSLLDVKGRFSEKLFGLFMVIGMISDMCIGSIHSLILVGNRELFDVRVWHVFTELVCSNGVISTSIWVPCIRLGTPPPVKKVSI